MVGSELGLNKQEKDKSRNFGRKIENAVILCYSWCEVLSVSTSLGTRLRRARSENQNSKYFPSEITMEIIRITFQKKESEVNIVHSASRFKYKHTCLHQLITGFL